MEAFGGIGFILGIILLVYVLDLADKVKKLERQIKELKNNKKG